MDKFFYILFIKFYSVIAALLSPFNNKAKLWLKGRKKIIKQVQDAMPENATTIWMHCASLGEFEQGRPLLEAFKKKYPGYKLVLTFFSPSGYEVQKNSNIADYIFYLPIDSKNNARKFIKLVNPSLIVFVKYEYWYYYLKEANAQKIPLLLVSGIFFPDFSFFKWYGKMRREMLPLFYIFFCSDKQFKNAFGINQY